MAEKTKSSVAAVLRKGNQILGVERPQDPHDRLSGLWGLPAVTLDEGESLKEAVERIGLEKLGIPISPLKKIGAKIGQRAFGRMILYLWECTAGSDPDFNNRLLSDPKKTQYLNWGWKNPESFIAAASKGSLCTQILLDKEGIKYDC